MKKIYAALIFLLAPMGLSHAAAPDVIIHIEGPPVVRPQLNAHQQNLLNKIKNINPNFNEEDALHYSAANKRAKVLFTTAVLFCAAQMYLAYQSIFEVNNVSISAIEHFAKQPHIIPHHFDVTRSENALMATILGNAFTASVCLAYLFPSAISKNGFGTLKFLLFAGVFSATLASSKAYSHCAWAFEMSSHEKEICQIKHCNSNLLETSAPNLNCLQFLSFAMLWLLIGLHAANNYEFYPHGYLLQQF